MVISSTMKPLLQQPQSGRTVRSDTSSNLQTTASEQHQVNGIGWVFKPGEVIEKSKSFEARCCAREPPNVCAAGVLSSSISHFGLRRSLSGEKKGLAIIT